MTVSPFATKDRVRRLEDRVAALEALLDRAIAEGSAELAPVILRIDRNTRTLAALEAHRRARDAAVEHLTGGRPTYHDYARTGPH